MAAVACQAESAVAARPSVSAGVAARPTVSETMAKLKAQKKAAFIPYLCAGDPNLETTAEAIRRLDNLGADVIELGVPYSDPLADGPVIQSAGTRALNAGTTLDKVLAMAQGVVPGLKAPVIIFTYYNTIMRRGMDKFCSQIHDAGITGLLVPDIPLEETPGIRAAAAAQGVELVLLSTPTTPEARMSAIAEASQGFVYLVSLTGVTGIRNNMEARVQQLIERLHSATDKSVAVGFGVSRPEQCQQIVAWGAEGVIVGSALVRALGEAPSPAEGLDAMETLAKSLRAAI